MCSTVLQRWITGPWVTSLRAWLHQVQHLFMYQAQFANICLLFGYLCTQQLGQLCFLLCEADMSMFALQNLQVKPLPLQTVSHDAMQVPGAALMSSTGWSLKC